MQFAPTVVHPMKGNTGCKGEAVRRAPILDTSRTIATKLAFDFLSISIAQTHHSRVLLKLTWLLTVQLFDVC